MGVGGQRAQSEVWRENFYCQNSLFFVFFGALFEQNGAAQTGILTKATSKIQGVSSI